jgi:pimeloyl-ACP methyl ester carboxylesterase
MTRSFQLRENVLELKGKFVDVAGTNTRYYDLGEGEPTILIHGGGPGASGVSNYRKNIEPLSARRRVIVIDLSGFGETEGKLKDGPVFPAMGDFVRDFMDVIGVKKASFVGNSMGGATSLMVALRAPERVNKLVLMGTGGSQPIFSPMPTEGLRQMAMFYGGEGPTMEKLKGVIDLLVIDTSSITEQLMAERLKGREAFRYYRYLQATTGRSLARESCLALPSDAFSLGTRGSCGPARFELFATKNNAQRSTSCLSEVWPLGSMGKGG